jgi:hypothetical protein
MRKATIAAVAAFLFASPAMAQTLGDYLFQHSGGQQQQLNDLLEGQRQMQQQLQQMQLQQQQQMQQMHLQQLQQQRFGWQAW